MSTDCNQFCTLFFLFLSYITQVAAKVTRPAMLNAIPQTKLLGRYLISTVC